MDEQDIYNDFAHGDMTWHEAIIRLQKIGYSRGEAIQVADEWAEGLDADNQQRWEQEMGF